MPEYRLSCCQNCEAVYLPIAPITQQVRSLTRVPLSTNEYPSIQNSRKPNRWMWTSESPVAGLTVVCRIYRCGSLGHQYLASAQPWAMVTSAVLPAGTVTFF